MPRVEVTEFGDTRRRWLVYREDDELGRIVHTPLGDRCYVGIYVGANTAVELGKDPEYDDTWDLNEPGLEWHWGDSCDH